LYEPLDEVEDYYDIDPFTEPKKVTEMVSGNMSSKCGSVFTV
jgi:hypothetical protein